MNSREGQGGAISAPSPLTLASAKPQLGKVLNTKEIRTLLCMCRHVVVFYGPGVAREVLSVVCRSAGK